MDHGVWFNFRGILETKVSGIYMGFKGQRLFQGKRTSCHIPNPIAVKLFLKPGGVFASC